MNAETLRTSVAAGIIRDSRIVVVLRRVEPIDRLLGLVDELVDVGARAFEITMDAPDAAAGIRAVRSCFDARTDGPFAVGAGTVLERTQLRAAIDGGAMFGVAPVLDQVLLREALDAGLPFVPGCFTPSEALLAWQTGASFVKLFPASALGPSFVRELRGPLPEISVIPTGGVDATNAPAFLAAGAAAVGVGGAFVRGDATERAAIMAAVRRGREGSFGKS